MPARTSDEKGVRLSVYHTRALWQNGRKICLDFIRYKRSFTLVLWEEERLVGGGDPFYLTCWVNRPRWSEIADFEPIFARSASAVTPSEKVQLTIIGSGGMPEHNQYSHFLLFPLVSFHSHSRVLIFLFPFSFKFCYFVPFPPEPGQEQGLASTAGSARDSQPWMTSNGVMAVALRYFTEFGKPAF